MKKSFASGWVKRAVNWTGKEKQ